MFRKTHVFKLERNEIRDANNSPNTNDVHTSVYAFVCLFVCLYVCEVSV